MIKGNIDNNKGKIKKELILEKVDEYNIFRYYLGQDFDFKKKYKSPFRNSPDNTPNLCFRLGDDGKILFKDFANGKGGDCFNFVQYLFNLDFYQALAKIDEDFGLGIKSKSPVFKIHLVEKPDSIHQQVKLIQIIPRDFTEEDIRYWNNYHIYKIELDKKKVYSIDKLYINKQLITQDINLPRFAYQFDNYLKIYSPFSRNYKWISSCPNDFISGFDEIKYKVFSGTQNKRLIISKSVKDEMVLSKFFLDVCSTQNESSNSINEENMQWILKGYKPEDVYIAYDNDEPGMKAASYYVDKYGFKPLHVPKEYITFGIKDWADLARYMGLNTVLDCLRKEGLFIY